MKKKLPLELSVQPMMWNRTNREKMSVIGIYCVLVYFGSLQNLVHSTDWVDKLTRYIVEDSRFYQVKLITRLIDNGTLTDPLIEELSVKLMHNLPTVRIDLGNNFEPPVDLTSGEVGAITPVDTSATLFLLVIECRRSLPIPTTKKFIDVVAEMATYHYTSKYLMIYFVRFGRDSLEELLEHAWKKKMLDFTIIELVESQGLNHSIAIKRTAASPIIHQLNPFKGEYSKAKSSMNKNDLFPDKVSNLWGYNLTILGSVSANGPPLLLLSAKARVLDAVLEKLNCGLNQVKYWPGDGRSIYSMIENNNIDLTTDVYPYFFEDAWNDTQRTAILRIDRFCPLVPILPKYETGSFTNLFKAYALSFGIVLIFWIFLRLLRFRTYSSRMFSIGRVLFGISVTQQPGPKVERIIFTSLLVIFAVYSSIIYTAITDISLVKIGHVEFESLEDFDRWGLIPYMKERDFIRAQHVFTGPLEKLGNQMNKEKSIYGCIAWVENQEKKVCFTDERSAKYWIQSSMKPPTMKFSKACLWHEPLSFIVGKRSPYRSRINKLIMRLLSSGIGTKPAAYEDVYSKIKPAPRDQIETTSALPQLLAVSVVGYSLSVVVFIAEIIYHRVSVYIKSKKLSPSSHFPYTA